MQQMQANDTHRQPQCSLPISQLGLGSLHVSAYPLKSLLEVVWNPSEKNSRQCNEVKGDENSQCWMRERCWREGG
jgi:hypothetical protein